MLKECRSHGFFRGESCPSCSSRGRFLLNEQEIELLGKTLAGILRHFPERYGLSMDEHGWIDLNELVTAVQVRHKKFRFLKMPHVLGMIQTDPKGRYQFLDGRIRATYAHSVEVDLDLPTDGIPDDLFYPATKEECSILLETGLKPADRKRVHLSATFESAMEAGKVRTENPQIIKINAKKAIKNGVVIQRAGKTVYLAKEMPPEFLSLEE